ncbi:phosphatase PAP2 family protein [Sporocytophaga myxococcoides]|uniref:phosphatase PAP2 family protein n=1 Tax=Sporocytophaga myxococcoides TaxID=153721 RepID=UPI00041882E9|nr:phosphatase PAP2 family protein [Sporocytophaga myxococcoides]
MIKVVLTGILILLNIFNVCLSQTCPYRVRAIDVISIPVAGGLSYLGLKELRAKPRLDSAYVVTLSPEDVNAFDRGAARNNQSIAGTYSDAALYTAIALPFLTLADKNIRHDGLKIVTLYLETMGAMGVIYTWGVSQTRRKRPYVYNSEVEMEKRTGKGALNSFFAGHPAAAAASTFFAAKVLHDYYPDMKNEWIIWTAASIPPALVAYFRYQNGQHFPTDIIAGLPIGVALGILIPEIHKRKKDANISIIPTYYNQTGIVSFTYKF